MTRTRTPGVFKRGGGYVVVYYVEGKQRKESARTYDEARRLKSARQADLARGEFHDASRTTFHTYFCEWVERYRGRGQRGFRESTREEYRRLGTNYALRYFRPPRRISEITPREIANFIEWLCSEEEQGKRLSDATIGNILNPVRACLRSAVQEGLIRHNPTLGIALPSRPDPDRDEEEGRRAMSEEQLETFLAIVPATHKPMFLLLATTGIRISEALALRWRDLTLDGPNPGVHVRRAFVKGRMVKPKTRYSKRTVPLDHSVVTELRSRRTMVQGDGDDLAFQSNAGGPLDQDNLRSRILKPTAEEAGVPWIGFHSFRHTCASLLFDRGDNAVQVQRWLGHHSAAFTLDRYVHLLPDAQIQPLSLSPALPLTGAPVATSVATLAPEPPLRIPQNVKRPA